MESASLEEHHDSTFGPTPLDFQNLQTMKVVLALAPLLRHRMSVVHDHYCEAGASSGSWDGTTFHSADLLWDGQGCGGNEAACCAVPGQPWFYKVLDAPTTDYIEMRLCISESTDGENVLISSYEIYVM